MTTIETTNLDYGDSLAMLNGRKHRKVGNNTYARLEDDDRIVVKYHDTDILTFHPNGEVEYQSGGWLTYSTKDRFNSFGARGIRITQTAGRWYVFAQGKWDNGALTDYYDGMRVKDGQVTTKVVHSGDPDKVIKQKIDRYVKGYTDDEIKRLLEGTGRGDCWYCQMRVSGTDVELGEHTGNHDHLREHVKENYRMVNLAYNAIKAAGYRDPAGILHYSPDLVRRAIRRYLRQRLATHTAGAAGGTKPHAEHWAG